MKCRNSWNFSGWTCFFPQSWQGGIHSGLLTFAEKQMSRSEGPALVKLIKIGTKDRPVSALSLRKDDWNMCDFKHQQYEGDHLGKPDI